MDDDDGGDGFFSEDGDYLDNMFWFSVKEREEVLV